MLTRRELFKFSTTARREQEGYWLHLSRTAMACRFEATLSMTDRGDFNIVHDALAAADRHEQQLTIFRDSSEVSLINQTAPVRPVPVEQSLFDLLLLCRELSSETGGAFDAASGALSETWGFLRRLGRVPDTEEIERALDASGMNKVVLDESSREIRFTQPGLRLNFGAVGKGWALDRIAGLIKDRVRRCLLSAGSSSVLAIGRAWSVGVRHPRDRNRRIAVLNMSDCAMATSGSDEQFFEHEGRRYGHIIDPRSGYPAEGVEGVTVIAPTAATADALATAFFVGGAEQASKYCSNHPGTLAIMLESGARRPIVLGESNRCRIEAISE